jgi:hypothetical protein
MNIPSCHVCIPCRAYIHLLWKLGIGFGILIASKDLFKFLRGDIRANSLLVPISAGVTGLLY